MNLKSSVMQLITSSTLEGTSNSTTSTTKVLRTCLEDPKFL